MMCMMSITAKMSFGSCGLYVFVRGLCIVVLCSLAARAARAPWARYTSVVPGVLGWAAAGAVVAECCAPHVPDTFVFGASG